jgi:hypothetical protein
MNEAIHQMNNEAVAMMVAGDDHAALAILKRAVCLTKAVLRLQPPVLAHAEVRPPPVVGFVESIARLHSVKKEENNVPSRMSLSPQEVKNSGSENKNTNLIHQQSAELRYMHDREWFLFNKAIYFDTEAVSSAAPFAGDIHTYCAVVIFNLALVYHRNIIRGNTNCIGKAEPLYALIVKLLGHNCTNSLTATMVKLASMNNLAQLRYAAGHIQEVQGRRLLQLSVAIRRSRRTFQYFQSDESDLKGFLGNVMLLQAMPTAPAA